MSMCTVQLATLVILPGGAVRGSVLCLPLKLNRNSSDLKPSSLTTMPRKIVNKNSGFVFFKLYLSQLILQYDVQQQSIFIWYINIGNTVSDS